MNSNMWIGDAIYLISDSESVADTQKIKLITREVSRIKLKGDLQGNLQALADACDAWYILANGGIEECMQGVNDLVRFAYNKLKEIFNTFIKELKDEDKYQLESQKLTNYIKGCSKLDDFEYDEEERKVLVIGSVDFYSLDYVLNSLEELKTELKQYIAVKG